MACKLKYCDPVQEVTIIPRGMAGGYTMTRPDNDDNYQSKQMLLDQIVMTLGGRVAEELVIKNITGGASSDIRKVTQIAHAMVAELGMSDEIGPIFYGSDHEVFVGKNYASQNSFSEHMASKIDQEANKIIRECHERARQILGDNIEILHNMARVLLEKETIHTTEVDMLIAGESAQTVIDFIDKKYNPDKPVEVIKPVETVVEQPVETVEAVEQKTDDDKPTDEQN